MKYIFRLSLLVLCALILSACTDDSDVDEEAEGEAADDNAAESSGDLVLSTGNDVVSMDPHFCNSSYSAQLRNTFFNDLVCHDENLEYLPLLGECREQVDDLTWQYTLYGGVTFHDGRGFSADAVKANLERVQDPALA